MKVDIIRWVWKWALVMLGQRGLEMLEALEATIERLPVVHDQKLGHDCGIRGRWTRLFKKGTLRYTDLQ